MVGMCKCPHHVVVRVLYALAWVAGVLFFWSMWKGDFVFGYDEGQYAWSVVVLMVLAFGSKFCGCCGWHGKMMMGGMGDKMEGGMCKHGMDCKCNDCDRCK